MSSGGVVDASGGENTSWPEVVGLPAYEAMGIILKDKPDARIAVVPLGSPVPRTSGPTASASSSTPSPRPPRLRRFPFPPPPAGCHELLRLRRVSSGGRSGGGRSQEVNAVSEGIMTDELRNFLELNLPKVKEGKKAKYSVGVMESKVGSHISEATGIPCRSNEFVQELLQKVCLHLDQFIDQLKKSDMGKAQLGLGHSYSRAMVKFNVNHVDNTVIQSIFLLDKLDKDINSFAMRVKLKKTFQLYQI